MIFNFAKLLFDKRQKRLKQAAVAAECVLRNAKDLSELSDRELTDKTAEFRQRIVAGETLDDLIIDVYAVVSEVAYRVLNMRPFKVQIIGAYMLHYGYITEMKTGEGKTLVAALVAYLNALDGKGVHVVTVNDYLTRRDSEWMGRIYNFLGLSVGCLVSNISLEERINAYQSNITYATNNELAFDYLRDTTVFEVDQMIVRKPYNFAVIDEADSVLIDEARTPIILSGPSDITDTTYRNMNKIVRGMSSEHYEIDNSTKNVFLTDIGMNYAENKLKEAKLIDVKSDLYSLDNMSVVHGLNQALRAHTIFVKDREYVVMNGKVIIIDEFTGRMMEDRRYSDGLHQAIEAKENVRIKCENKTIASVTFQNYFKMYNKVAGMTGTAVTEEEEFMTIYGLPVIAVPTNAPVSRIDYDDEVYGTEKEKYEAILKLITECHRKKQPILVGTVSIEKSEKLSKMLHADKIPHNVLNAKHHEKEAYIIAQAGRPGAVTIATNMAGRGTDIKLGGNAEMIAHEYVASHNLQNDNNAYSDALSKALLEVAQLREAVLAVGGLYVIGTERHDSRRIDNQLRGRAGRQGDKGGSKFFVALDDDLMRMFGGVKLSALLTRLGLKDGQAINHPMVTGAIARAQSKIEKYHHEVRKNINKFDNIIDEQRKIVIAQRLEIMNATDDILESYEAMREQVNSMITDNAFTGSELQYGGWNVEGMHKNVYRVYAVDVANEINSDINDKADVLATLNKLTESLFNDKIEALGHATVATIQRRIWLMTLTSAWCEHLTTLSNLQQSIHLRAMGQKDPFAEYARESFVIFEAMLNDVDEHCVSRFARLPIVVQDTEETEPKGGVNVTVSIKDF